MESIEIEALSMTTNCAVVRLPNRRFPGIVIQGDSFKNLVDLFSEIEKESPADDPEQSDRLEEFRNILHGYLEQYENSLRMNSIELPYPK